MKEKKIINCLYGGIAVESFLLAKKFKYLFVSNLGIDLMFTGLVVPYWFIILLGLVPLTPVLIDFINNNKDYFDKNTNLEEISDLLNKYNLINKED